MKLKRVTAILLAGVMAMGLVACGSGSDTAADTTTSTSTATDLCSPQGQPSRLHL